MAEPTITSFNAAQFTVGGLIEAKAELGLAISLCLPARNEAATVGPIVESVRATLMGTDPLVDELLVIDDHSTDQTASVAADAGAAVVAAGDVLGELGLGHGKGQALWKSLFVTKGDLVAWCDADLRHFDARFVVGLVGPLLVAPEIAFVKGFYARPVEGSAGGGRVTELVARPALSLLFPALAGVVQPLAGEYAGRRHVLERLPFLSGYGVDLGLLIDAFAQLGPGALAQTDLGVRHHRNRPLDELGPEALAVLHAALHRTGVPLAAEVALRRPHREPVVVRTLELPPLVEVAAYRDRDRRV